MIKLISQFNSCLLHRNQADSLAADTDFSSKSSVEGFNSSFSEYAYIPSLPQSRLLTEEEVHQQAQNIFKWALEKGADHYTFISYPHTSSICEKQQSFINLEYVKDDKSFHNNVKYEFAGRTLIKGQGDGSSFPSGGLRKTHTARGYTIWDPLSQLYIRKQHKMLYIPALLVSHNGHALDDKTLFRQSQFLLEKNSITLLNKLGIKTQSVSMLLGLEQEFFVITKSSFTLRPDIRSLGRSLVGNIPARNQQFGQHYYGKMNTKVQKVLQEIELEALEIGIPFKTKHNQVALNQFEVCSICDEAGRSIDQNMILMQIMKETFEKHDLAVLLHEKPFRDMNGSGKHANWSLNYVKQDGSLKNLFALSSKDTPLDAEIFKLFILLNLRAVLRNHKLYLTAIATPGNEIRLGGHQAPPRIVSVFLGTALSNFLDGKEAVTQKNLQEIISFLNFQVSQENTDRNRTSPYAYTGNRFEFRAVGSSQNPSFAMAVIAATLANEIGIATARLENGQSLSEIIEDLRVQTQAIRFEGDGYSEEWKVEAKKRGLYVNENFSQIFQTLEAEQEIFKDLNICSSSEIKSRAEVSRKNYEQVVLTESEVFLQICYRHVIPEGFGYLQSIERNFKSEALNGYADEIRTHLQNVIVRVNQIKRLKSEKLHSLLDYQNLRNYIEESSESVNALIARLPKSSCFPDLYEILNM